MTFLPTPFEGCYEVQLTPHGDSRGWFSRVYSKDEFKEIGHEKEWVQMNHSFTSQTGTVRGMHFQKLPFAEIKLVRCIAGAIQDVIIDLRKGSSTFLHTYSVKLSARQKNMLYIPEGFAHGFQTLTEDCELIYLHSAYYTPEAEAGIRFDDPLVQINWLLPVRQISERDKSHPYLDQHFKGI